MRVSRIRTRTHANSQKRYEQLQRFKEAWRRFLVDLDVRYRFYQLPLTRSRGGKFDSLARSGKGPMNLHRRTFLGSLLALTASEPRKAKILWEAPRVVSCLSLNAELNTRRRYPLGMTPKALNQNA